MITEPFGAIFDLDGTLVDAFADIAEAVNVPLRRRGLPERTNEEIRTFVGDGVGKLLDRAGRDIPEAGMEEFRREALEQYRAHPADRAQVYDGVREALTRLRGEGIKTGVLSNKPQAMTIQTCDQLGLLPLFDDIRGEHPEESPRKPDPRALLEQMERLGITRAVMVGDGVPDGEVAQRAAVPFLACLWGTRTREQLQPYNPCGWAKSPAELADLILRLAGAPKQE